MLSCWKTKKRPKSNTSICDSNPNPNHNPSSSLVSITPTTLLRPAKSLAKFRLLDSQNGDEDEEDWWDLKSVWGKDWKLGRSKGQAAESMDSLHLISFRQQKGDPNNNHVRGGGSNRVRYDRHSGTDTDPGLGSGSDLTLDAEPSPIQRELKANGEIIWKDIGTLVESGGPGSHSQEVLSLRAELQRERESKERILEDNEALLVQLNSVLEAQEVTTQSRQALELQLVAAERRLIDARSDWDREREHSWEEAESSKRAHSLELQRLQRSFQEDLICLKDRHQAELQYLKSSLTTDLNQIRASYQCRELEQDQRHDFEVEELKAKSLEDLETVESQYKVEMELLQHKLKIKSVPCSSPASKESSVDLLQKEITSLSVVVELRNSEIKDLRQEVMSQRLELERLHGVEDQNLSYLQKLEDLAAQVQKTRDDKKKLIVENQSMQSSIHEALSAKEKISMELDFLRYRIEGNDGPTSASRDGLTDLESK